MLSRIKLGLYSHMISKSRIILPYSQNRSLHVSLRSKEVVSKINYLGCSSSSTIFNINFARAASTNTTENVPVENLLPQIPDIPVPIEPEIIGAVAEETLASYGLGGIMPIGATQHLLFWMHSTCGLPWWTAIIAGSAVLKIMLLPIFIKLQRHHGLSAVYKKDLDYFERRRRETSDDGDSARAAMYITKQDQFCAKHNMLTMKKIMMLYVVQGMAFSTFFFAVRGISIAEIPSMREGGLWWFSDLTVADPYYLLPLLSAACGAMFIHFTPAPKISGISKPNIPTYLKFTLPCLSLPFLIYFKASVLLYIITSTWMTFISQALIRIPKIRALCNIAPVVKRVEEVSNRKQEPSKGVLETIKSTWHGVQRSRALRATQGFDSRRFTTAGRGPIVKTYKFDPTKVVKKTSVNK